MDYSLNSISEYAGLFVGYPYSKYAERHRYMSWGNNWNGHTVLALVESIPLLGGIIALIEKLVVYLFKTYCSPFFAARQVRERPIAFQKDIALSDLENHKKLVARARSYETSSRADHNVSFMASFDSVAIVKIMKKNPNTASIDLSNVGEENLDEIRHRKYRDLDQYLIYQTIDFFVDAMNPNPSRDEEPLRSRSMMTISHFKNMQYSVSEICEKIPEYTNAIFVYGLYNFFNREYRAGSTLIQLAIEESLQCGFEGRVALNSINDSKEFYLRLGFLSLDGGRNGNYMYLPKSSIEEWKKKIAQNPLMYANVDRPDLFRKAE